LGWAAFGYVLNSLWVVWIFLVACSMIWRRTDPVRSISDISNVEALIRHIKNLVPIPDGHLSLITGRCRAQYFPKKAHLLHQEEFAKQVHFILQGCVRTYVFDYNGVEHTLSFSMEDYWFGDLQSFIRNTPASFNIQALEDTHVLSISQRDWEELLAEVPEFVSYTRILFRNTMFSHENRILQGLSYTAEERYRRFLAAYPTLPQRISQKHIASYLGITPEFLSMLRKKIKG